MLLLAFTYNITDAFGVSLNSGADVPVVTGNFLEGGFDSLTGKPCQEVVFVHGKSLTIYEVASSGSSFYLDYFAVVPTFLGASEVSRGMASSDIDDDGSPGLVVAAHDTATNSAVVHVVLGKSLRSALFSPLDYAVATSDGNLTSFGSSIVARGSRIVVGDPLYGGATKRGKLWVIDYDGSSFSTAATITGTSNNDELSSGLAVGDFYGNSTLALAVGVPGSKKVVIYDFSGDFSSSIEEITDSAKANFGRYVLFWDGDNDGVEELVIGDGSNCYVYKRKAAGPSLVATISGAIEPLSVGDFNGDGIEDVAVKTSGGFVVIKGGSYSSTMDSASSDYSFTVSNFYKVVLSDLNGDGYSDVVISPDSTSGNGYVFFSPLLGFYARLPLSQDFEFPFEQNAKILKGYGPSGVDVLVFPYVCGDSSISFVLRFSDGSDYIERLASSVKIALPLPSYDNYALYVYNSTKAAWDFAGRAYDKNSTHVIFPVGTAGIYAIRPYSEFPESLSGVCAFPNPANYGDKIYFAGITQNATARIYTPSGRLVRVITVESGSLYWDGRDYSGSPVDRGVYIVVIDDPVAKSRKTIKVFLK